MLDTPRRHIESIALVIDISFSATSAWEKTRLTAQRIQLLWEGSTAVKLFMLGSRGELPSDTLKQTTPPRFGLNDEPCSLIAPIMEELRLGDQQHLVIVVGSGEIFDLPDWIGLSIVDGWLLVCTGDWSLQGESGRIREITPDQIRDQQTLLSYVTTIPQQQADRLCEAEDDEGSSQWAVDPSGYPLIWVDPLGSFVHLFPITKPQFERFMVSGDQKGLGDEWYSEILRISPRASYRSRDFPFPEHLFMTGITTDEASLFSRWLGRHYRLLTAEEWCLCYEWLESHSASSIPPGLTQRLSGDAKMIWTVIRDNRMEKRECPSLRELSLMTKGILEWVVERPGRYCGLGEPASNDYQRKACDPVHPLGAEPRRLKNLGFRLHTRVT